MAEPERRLFPSDAEMVTLIRDLFQQLSPDEQLKALPAVLDTVLATDRRDRIVHYLETLLFKVAPDHSPFYVDQERLKQTQAFTIDELAQFSSHDLAEISDRLQTHYREDWYPEEIIFHAQALLDEKAKAPTE